MHVHSLSQNLNDESLNVNFKLQLVKKNGEAFEEKISEQVLVAKGSRGWRRSGASLALYSHRKGTCLPMEYLRRWKLRLILAQMVNCLCNCKTIGTSLNSFDVWADISLHLLLLKSSKVYGTRKENRFCTTFTYFFGDWWLVIGEWWLIRLGKSPSFQCQKWKTFYKITLR